MAERSIRSTAGTADQTLIVGFAIVGGSKPVLVRGIGPALTRFGVQGALADPKLDFRRSEVEAVVASNDNWAAAAAEVFAGSAPLRWMPAVATLPLSLRWMQPPIPRI